MQGIDNHGDNAICFKTPQIWFCIIAQDELNYMCISHYIRYSLSFYEQTYLLFRTQEGTYVSQQLSTDTQAVINQDEL